MNDAPNQTLVHIGIDVCSTCLDIAGLPNIGRLSNNPEGHQKLIKALPPQTHVILEASGGCEQLLWLTLLRTKIPVSRINPGRARHYACASGQRAKTDKLDAQMLLAYGQGLRPKPDTLPSDELLQLQALIGRREQLVAMRAVQKVQLQQLTDPQIQTQAEELIGFLSKQIKALEKSIATALKGQEFKARAERLRLLPGVGSIASATLLALMPELGHQSDGQLCSLAGVAPYAHESGPMKGQRRIHGGRARVRRVLYMTAVSSLKFNPVLKAFYDRLRKHGKPAKLVLTAMMRKILCVLNKLLTKPDFVLAT